MNRGSGLEEKSMQVSTRFRRAAACAVLATAFTTASGAEAVDKVTVGALRFTSHAPTFIAYERGYFKAEGLDVELKFFQAAQPVAVARSFAASIGGCRGWFLLIQRVYRVAGRVLPQWSDRASPTLVLGEHDLCGCPEDSRCAWGYGQRRSPFCDYPGLSYAHALARRAGRWVVRSDPGARVGQA